MPEPSQSLRAARFGVFQIDLGTGELRRQGVKIKLQEKPFQVLAMLLERPGEVVTREELRERLWAADTFVDFDHGVSTAVNKLREALGDTAENPRFVETLPRRGYRFIVPVERLDGVGRAGLEAGKTHPWLRRAPKRVVGIGAFVVLVLALSAYIVQLRFWPKESPPVGRVMLVVLPFHNLSGDPEQEYFSDGLTEEMIAQLGQVQPKRIGVIARTSAMHYKKSEKPVDEIGRELGVDYVLEGSVRRESNQVRITAQLIQVRDQSQVWGETYDRELGQMLALQNEIARTVAGQIRVNLTADENARLAQSRPVDPEAYEDYLRGLSYLHQGLTGDWRKSQQHFERVIAKDPAYAPAQVGLAALYIRLAAFGPLTPEEAWPRAEAATERALELDDNLAEAHAALAFIRFVRDWNWAEAEKEFQRALELNPNSPDAHWRYAYYLRTKGQMDEAIRESKIALELDPLREDLRSYLVAMLWTAKRYDKAIEQCHKSLELHPSFAGTHHQLAGLYEEKGMDKEAAEEVMKWLTGVGEPAAASKFERIYKARGYRAARRFLYEQVIEKELKTPRPDPWTMAWVYARLGEKDKAFEWLEKAYQVRDPGLLQLRVDPDVDSLRSDPRYADLVRRIHFPN